MKFDKLQKTDELELCVHARLSTSTVSNDSGSDEKNGRLATLTEFIEVYQSFPCLWRVKFKNYSNKLKKNQAHVALVNKYKEVNREA